MIESSGDTHRRTILDLATREGTADSGLTINYEPERALVHVYAWTEDPGYETSEEMNWVSGGHGSIRDEPYLQALSTVRLGGTCNLSDIGGAELTVGHDRISCHYLRNRWGPPPPRFIPLSATQSDLLFLDSVSVIEDGYLRKKDHREIKLSVVERALLQLTTQRPDLIHSYSPRLFEYVVASLLVELGFSNVTLSRHWNDSGCDVWATLCDGDQKHAVVVEVKHYSRRKVGIAVVDRLNGVRAREGAARGVVVTSSHFSSQSIAAYESHRHRIALIDYERLVELLGNSGTWHQTPSGLWSADHHTPVQLSASIPRQEDVPSTSAVGSEKGVRTSVELQVKQGTPNSGVRGDA